jgi:hypothetical protein
MKLQMLALVSVALSAGLSSGALAEEEPSRTFDRPLTKEEARFRALDRNNDRQLSPEEFRVDATTTTEFTTLDVNHDGFLTMSEFISRPIPPAKTPEPKPK